MGKRSETGLLREFLQLREMLDNEALAGKIDETFGAEFIECGSDRLPRGPYKKGNFLMGKMHFDGDNTAFDLAEFLRISDKECRNAFMNVFENHLRNTFLETPETEANPLCDLEVEFRFRFQERLEIFFLHGANNGIIECLGKLSARFARSGECQFSEDFTRTNHVENYFFPIFGQAGDFDVSLFQKEDRLCRLIGEVKRLL